MRMLCRSICRSVAIPVLLMLLTTGCAHRARVVAPLPPSPPPASAAPASPSVSPLSNSAVHETARLRAVNVRLVARHADGTVFYEQEIHNLRTTGGADWQASVMGNTSAPPATANYIALSNDATAPAASDCAAGSAACTLTSEITTNGCARAQGTYAHSNGTATWTLAHTWTATGAQAVQKAGMFNASSSGTMVFVVAFSTVTLANTDTLTATWTVSI